MDDHRCWWRERVGSASAAELDGREYRIPESAQLVAAFRAAGALETDHYPAYREAIRFGLAVDAAEQAGVV